MGELDARVERALDAAGLDPAEIPGRVTLIAQAAGEFARATRRQPLWAWWVPGRIEIFGKHTDYAGGRSLVAAVPRGFAVVAGPRHDALVAARDARWQTATDIPLNDTTRAFNGWANYIAVVARRLSRDFPGAALGADIAFASDLPRAAGVSSSSALVVGIASALIERGQLAARPEWGRAITGRLDLAGYLGAVENGLTFGTFAEGGGVGTHGGSEDHTAILNCRAGSVSAFRYVPVRAVGEAALPAAWRFVVLASGVEASKAGAVKERYNALSLATRALVDLWRRQTGETGAATLGSILSASATAGADLAEWLRDSPPPGSDPAVLATRLAHFTAEDGRVPLALRAFADADAGAVGDLSAGSQRDAESLLRNQIPETSALAAVARETGAFAASNFGAGFGGSVWALTDADGAEAFLTRWREAYVARHPDRAQAAGFVACPAPSTVLIPLS